MMLSQAHRFLACRANVECLLCIAPLFRFLQRFCPLLRNSFFVLFIFLLLHLTGCATPKQTGWGGEVSLMPGWEKFERAAVNAAQDPGTWVPLAGAALVLASGRDEEWTQEAIRDTPVYGSRIEAGELSDEHTLLLTRLWQASLLLTDSGNEHWWSNKFKGAVAQQLIVNTSNGATNMLKRLITHREPAEDLAHVEYESFPSNHSTPPFTRVALIRRNLRYTPLNDFSRYSVLTASYLLATSIAYSRVEMGLHYFSDQLAGAALGNFIGLLLFDSFFEDESRWELQLNVRPDGEEASAQFSFAM